MHGTEPRGLSNTPRKTSYDGRFGRLFPKLAEQAAQDPDNASDDEALRAVAAAMTEVSGDASGNPAIPSGYVYLGQFVDHDITFDPTSQLQRRNDPLGLIDFRTPRFDLDSVYGLGPDASPHMYDNSAGPQAGLRFLTENQFDLPRNTQGRALIGDPRNDENGIVSQLHVAFLNLHNRLMDQLSGDFPDARDCFNEAQRQAQWHYQWVVAHDFLRRTVGVEMHEQLLTTHEVNGSVVESVNLGFYRHKVRPFMPVEFSVAAYRFGHSQVRDRYSINGTFNEELFSPTGVDFRGFQRLRDGWQASWPFFFEMDSQPAQSSQLIDSHLSQALFQLQGGAGDDANLALRNLRRGAALGLPSGQAVSQAMGVDPLTDVDLAPAPADHCPLWFYVLREAEIAAKGQHLGPVGGRIVGEVLLGLLRADPQSYLQLEPSWTPSLPARLGDQRAFDMVDLLKFAVPDQSTRF